LASRPRTTDPITGWKKTRSSCVGRWLYPKDTPWKKSGLEIGVGVVFRAIQRSGRRVQGSGLRLPGKNPGNLRERVILGRSRRPMSACKETIMLNPTSLLADALGRNLGRNLPQNLWRPRAAHCLRPGRRRPARHRAHRQQRRALSRLRTHGARHPLRPGYFARPAPRANHRAQRLGPYHLGSTTPRHRICAWHLRRRHGRAFRDRRRRQHRGAPARRLRAAPPTPI